MAGFDRFDPERQGEMGFGRTGRPIEMDGFGAIDVAAPEAASVFCDNPAILPDNDAIGIGVDLDRAADGAGVHRVFIVVEADQARLRHRSWQRIESVEAPTIGNKPGRSSSKTSQTVLSARSDGHAPWRRRCIYARFHKPRRDVGLVSNCCAAALVTSA